MESDGRDMRCAILFCFDHTTTLPSFRSSFLPECLSPEQGSHKWVGTRRIHSRIPPSLLPTLLSCCEKESAIQSLKRGEAQASRYTRPAKALNHTHDSRPMPATWWREWWGVGNG